MKKFFLILALSFVSIVSFGQSKQSELIEKIEFNKVMMDSCFRILQDMSISKSNRHKYKRKYTIYKINYENLSKKYDRMFGFKNPINEAGRYLKKSANYEACALGCLGIETVATIVIVSNNSSDNSIAIASGGVCGIAGLSFYIASIINKHKAGKFLNNVKFTGNGIQITF